MTKREESIGSGNINQIRDILIGPFQREQAARFDRMEQALQRAIADSADATRRAEESLQKGLDTAVDSLEAKLSDLSKRISDLDETRRREATAMADDFGTKLKALDTRVSKELRDLEKHSDDRLRVTREQIEAALADLRNEKTSRFDLGDYLTEIGLRLKGESSLSELENSLQEALGGDEK